jgi:MYXO-CTERM domain-containing protein
VVSVGPESALVVFRDERPFGPSWLPAYGGLRMQRVSFDGTPLEAASTQLLEAKNLVRAFGSASDGNGHLVVWVESLNTSRTEQLYVQRVGLDGVASQAATLLTQSAPDAKLGDIQVAPAQGGYLVTFGQGSVLASRVASDGTPIGTPFALSPGDSAQTHARVAFEGDTDLVVWQDERQPPAALWMTRVAEDGGLLDPIGQRLTRGTVDASNLQMVSLAGGAYAVWSSWGGQGAELHGAWFAHDGLTEHEEGTALPVDVSSPVLASDGEHLTLLGTRADAMWAAHLDRKGGLLDAPVAVSAGSSSYGQQALGVLPDGSVLVVYARPDETDIAPRIRVRKLAAPAQADLPPDAGAPDSGRPSGHDAGARPSVDAGPSSIDAGSALDGGTAHHDGGLEQPRDAGLATQDAGAGAQDAGGQDPEDAGAHAQDAAVHGGGDAGAADDAGPTARADGGAIDTPNGDAGSADAGPGQPALADAGDHTGAQADAGASEDGTPGDGCSCRVAPSQVGMDRGLWALTVFGYLARRRRRQSSGVRTA